MKSRCAVVIIGNCIKPAKRLPGGRISISTLSRLPKDLGSKRTQNLPLRIHINPMKIMPRRRLKSDGAKQIPHLLPAAPEVEQSLDFEPVPPRRAPSRDTQKGSPNVRSPRVSDNGTTRDAAAINEASAMAYGFRNSRQYNSPAAIHDRKPNRRWNWAGIPRLVGTFSTEPAGEITESHSEFGWDLPVDPNSFHARIFLPRWS